MRLQDLGPAGRRQIEAMDAAAERAARERARPILEEMAARGRENELQRAFEAWLTHHGYWPRDRKHLPTGGQAPPRGWYIHLVEARQNPLLLDVLLLGNDGRWLELELKAEGTRVAAHQATLVMQDPQRRGFCYSLEGAIKRVLEWEEAA